MKKKGWVVFAVVAVFFFAGAAIAYLDEGGVPFKMVMAEAQEKEASEEKQKEDAKPVEAEADLQGAEGIFTGRIDSHSVEVEIDGETKIFGLTDELRDEEFYRGEIAFKYYVDKNQRPVITEADFEVPERGEVQTAEGVFNGFADNHTVEISINGKEKAFGIDEGITFTGIEEEEELLIFYQDSEHGRAVIMKIERIF